jgi:2-oxoglutarate ferredoxin oxidoreductase subunit alpha
MYEEYFMDDAEICVVGFGVSARTIRGAVKEARELGIKAGMFRPITLWPFPVKPIRAIADKVKAFLTVECSMGQMVEDVKLASECKKPVHFYGRAGGTIPSPAEVLGEIQKILGGSK